MAVGSVWNQHISQSQWLRGEGELKQRGILQHQAAAEWWIFFIKDVVLEAKNPALNVAFSGFNGPKLVLKLHVRSCCWEPAGRFESSHEILTSRLTFYSLKRARKWAEEIIIKQIQPCLFHVILCVFTFNADGHKIIRGCTVINAIYMHWYIGPF